ncbi:unnamed protein product [Allacma fusca]|uniref:Uncharacterized protein n=1 Tax=Allacma fusca TaxID=39272 RepID=A0A8J2LMW3_9HEXA|nr:unnamed protein product [Allacma fusca]
MSVLGRIQVPWITMFLRFLHCALFSMWTGLDVNCSCGWLKGYLLTQNTIRNSVSTCVCICWIAVHLEIIYRLSVSVTLAGSDGVFCQQYGIYRLEL